MTVCHRVKSEKFFLAILDHEHEYRQRAVAILDAVRLSDRIDYYPDNLSGGQK